MKIRDIETTMRSVAVRGGMRCVPTRRYFDSESDGSGGGGSRLPLHFTANTAGSTISMVSQLATAPSLEYSTDGETWQTWQHTTADGVHTFAEITLESVGEKVYFRGNNTAMAGVDEESGNFLFSSFVLTGSVAAGGNVMSIIGGGTRVPDYGLTALFADVVNLEEVTALTAAPDMSAIRAIGYYGCGYMYYGCTSLTTASDLGSVTTIGDYGCSGMYYGCTSIRAAAICASLSVDGAPVSNPWDNYNIKPLLAINYNSDGHCDLTPIPPQIVEEA